MSRTPRPSPQPAPSAPAPPRPTASRARARGGALSAAPATALAVALSLALAVLPACTVTPLAAIPEPLPEALPWTVPGAGGAFLGIRGEENDSGSLDDLSFLPGVRITRVIENSPAAAAGMLAGDVVLAFAGRDLNDPEALDALVAGQSAGASVELSVRRGDTVLALAIVLAGAGGQPSPPEVRYRLDPARSRAGWATVPGGGARLVSAAKDSPCLRAGLAPGDTVHAIDGQPVLSDRALIRELQAREPGARVRLGVEPPGTAGAAGTDTLREVEVTLQEQPTRLTRVHIPFVFTWETSLDGERTSVDVLDLWVISLFEYDRSDGERTWTLLTLFGWKVVSVSTGVGELGS